MAPTRWIGMSADGQQVVLQRFNGQFNVPAPGSQVQLEDAAHRRRAAVLDVETTGLDADADQVIEIGVRTFSWNGRTGDLLDLGPHYAGLQDPGAPLSEEISRLTGLTDADLSGQQIDWRAVESLLDGVELIIAHNASFDRPFVDRHLQRNQHVWGCSLEQVDWRGLGFPVARLEVLSIFHGFFVDAHRALADADALLHLLSHTPPGAEQGYLVGMAAAAQCDSIDFRATGSPFDTKDLLKARRYRWQPEGRVWQKQVDAADGEAERQWLLEHIYNGQRRWQERVIQPQMRFRRS